MSPPRPELGGSSARRSLVRRPGAGRGARPPRPAAAAPERIAKFMARAGAGSRRDIERFIAEGRVRLNGEPVTHPATFVQPGDCIALDGRALGETPPTQLWRFHKPAGFLTTARDPAGRPTLYDLLPAGGPRLMPIGRLDLMTEGLLLLTNDGELKRRLELPANGWIRTYRARVRGRVSQAGLETLAEGVEIDGVRYGPVDASIDRRAGAGSANSWLVLSLAEGKNREVRRLCAWLGLEVSRLIRVAYGPFELGALPPRGLEPADPALVGERRGARLRDRRTPGPDRV